MENKLKDEDLKKVSGGASDYDEVYSGCYTAELFTKKDDKNFLFQIGETATLGTKHACKFRNGNLECTIVKRWWCGIHDTINNKSGYRDLYRIRIDGKVDTYSSYGRNDFQTK